MAEEVVDRLKAEGQLIRNTGTNSIRAVRIQLDRFESIFETISENIQIQTQMLTDTATIAKEQLKLSDETSEREAARAAQEELARDQQPTPAPEIIDDLPNKVSRDGPGLFSMLGGINLQKLLFGGAMVAGVGFAAYNVLKGYIDEKYNGAFSDFEDGIVDMVTGVRFDEITESFNQIKIAAESITNALGGLADAIRFLIDNPLALFGGTVLGGFGLGRALGGASVTDGESRTLRSRLSKVRFGLLSSIALLAVSLGDEAKQFLQDQTDIPAEWTDPAVDAFTTALVGASIGRMFGPTGMLVGAVAGLAISLGAKMIEWFKNIRDEASAKFREDVAEIEPLLEKVFEGGILSQEERRQLANMLAAAERRRTLMVSEEDIQFAEDSATKIREALAQRGLDSEEGITTDQLNDRLEKALAGDSDAITELVEYLEGRGMEGGEIADLARDFLYGQLGTAEGLQTMEEINSSLERLSEAIEALERPQSLPPESIMTESPTAPSFQIGSREIPEISRGQADVDRTTMPVEGLGTPGQDVPFTPITGPAGQTGFDSTEYQNMSTQQLIKEIGSLNQQKLQLSEEDPQRDIINNRITELYDEWKSREPLEIEQFRQGTKGFQDFGPASFAILHGREAVVPEETPAGRFLNQFFTEDWTPKMAPSSTLPERVEAAASGSINMPVIINNAPTVAPVVNNVQGGPSVTNTNLFGSGGGDRSRNPYGIPDAVN